MAALILFPPFTLDPTNASLSRHGEQVALRPKAFAVLRHLAERPGRLVTKQELLEAVWPKTFVSDTVLKVCITELRKALADGAAAAPIIQTVHRRGYRFVAPVGAVVDDAVPASRIAVPVVGREAEQAVLARALVRARAGERQIVIVSGEAGMGKTALVEAFLRDTMDAPGHAGWIARGQCVAQYGTGEPFLPVLEALDRLGRGRDGARVIDLMRRLAPEWLLQLPGLVSDEERLALRRQTEPAAPERMLRVGVALLEALAADRALVLVLEDMHWSDHSTVDLFARLAERPDAARLLVLATYRPAEAIARGHPLRVVAQELRARRRCGEILLGFLSEDATGDYLAARFPGAPLPAGLVAWLKRRTEGNPLFMVNVVDALVAAGLVVEEDGRAVPQPGFERIGVPESLRQMIEQQIDGLAAADADLVDAAAVAGAEFSAAAVAAGVGIEVVDAETRLRALAQRGHLVRDAGRAIWPDGTIAAQLAFVHSLYREVQYQRIAPARRAQIHRRIGERLAAACGAERPKAPAELALHFEQCGDTAQAIAYLQQAARYARRRGAHHEVVACLRRAIDLLGREPETPKRTRELVALHLRSGPSLVVSKGLGHPEVTEAYEAARALADAVGDTASSFLAHIGAWGTHFVRADDGAEHAAPEAFLRFAEATSFPPFVVAAHAIAGTDRFHRGELGAAVTHLERALAAPDYQPPGLRPDVTIVCLGLSSLALCLLGRVDDARRRCEDVAARADADRDPFDRTFLLIYRFQLAVLLRDVASAAAVAADAACLLREEDAPLAAVPRFVHAWHRATAGEAAAVDEMARDLDELDARGIRRIRPTCLVLLAEHQLACGRPRDAFACLEAAGAMVAATRERFYEAELHRMRGEWWRASAASGTGRKSRVAAAARVEAERCFRLALDVARGQQARWWELRAATSLARLLREQGREDEGRRVLAPIHAGITQGRDARDMLEAQALLA